MDINQFSSLVKDKYLRETKVYADFELYLHEKELVIPEKEFDQLIEEMNKQNKSDAASFGGSWVDRYTKALEEQMYKAQACRLDERTTKE